jgi:hypothetical protein
VTVRAGEAAREPLSVIPAELAEAVHDLPSWFVIGGHAVRCICPYRPSVDVDFGVPTARDMHEILARLEARGRVEIVERSADSVHLRFDDINVSLFVLDALVPFVEDRRLTTTGILATKLHAILDRGTRRDFFDLYVTLQKHALGIRECLAAMREVFGPDVNEGLLLRALTYFDDAEREAPLPGEGTGDWSTVTDFFLTRVGQLLVPPVRELEIQKRVVDVR